MDVSDVKVIKSKARPAQMKDAAAQARVDLTAALRMAARMGLNEGVCNHFSMEVPGRPDSS